MKFSNHFLFLEFPYITQKTFIGSSCVKSKKNFPINVVFPKIIPAFVSDIFKKLIKLIREIHFSLMNKPIILLHDVEWMKRDWHIWMATRVESRFFFYFIRVQRLKRNHMEIRREFPNLFACVNNQNGICWYFPLLVFLSHVVSFFVMHERDGKYRNVPE